jgi:hypothetical protein
MIVVAIITTVPPTLMGAAALAASLRNTKKLEAVKTEINGRMTQLLSAENAQGRQDERDSLKDADRD